MNTKNIIVVIVGSLIALNCYAEFSGLDTKALQDYADKKTQRAQALSAADADAVEGEVPEELMYKIIDDSKPNVGEEAVVYMGDTLLRQRSGHYADCFTPNFGHEKSNMGGWKYILKKGEAVCKNSAKSKYYTPRYINQWSVKNGNQNILDIKVTEKKGLFKVCARDVGMSFNCVKKIEPEKISFGLGFVSTKDGMQRSIEYAGKRGSQIKFIYAEFVDSLARDAFTREFEADLSEGSVVAYKGAVFEVIDANNASITYKIIRHFR